MKPMNAMKVRRPWFWLFVGANVVGAYVMLDTGELIGDAAGRPLHSVAALYLAVLLVLLSYWLILGPLFNALMRVRVKPVQLAVDEGMLGSRLGKLLLALQITYFLFNIAYGVNTAGSANSGESVPFALFWVFVPVDALMVIYYGYYRDNRLFYPNVIVWTVSNLARGWSGIFLFIIFFEWCRAGRRGAIRKGRVALLGLLVIVLYPVLINLKWIMRASAQTNLGFAEVADGFAAVLETEAYTSLVGDGLMQIVGRLQTTSSVVEVIRLRDLLQDEFAMGRFTPFWLEGLHGIVYDRLMHGVKSMPIGVAFTEYALLDTRLELGSWNTNIGYVGWFFIAPLYVPLYLAYTLLLGYLSVFLVKKVGMTAQASDMVWLTWLVYLLPPWHAAFVGFLYALAVFLVLKLIVSRKAAGTVDYALPAGSAG